MCINCDNYVKFNTTNTTNLLGVNITESYDNGELNGELIYELTNNIRIPFVLAKSAPQFETMGKNISGIFVSFTYSLEYHINE